MFNHLPRSAQFKPPKLVTTPDGGILYLGFRSVNYIGPVPDDNKSPEIKVIGMRQYITDLDIDPGWGQDSTFSTNIKNCKGDKFFAVLADDRSLQIWDFTKGTAIRGHNAHNYSARQQEGFVRPKFESPVLISYMCNRNVLSIDAQDIVVYCVASNTFCRLPMFVTSRNQQFTALRCSPFNENIFAVGTSRGLVLVCDIQEMKILYTLRGHNSPITKFAWVQVDPKQTIEKDLKIKNQLKCDEDDELFDIYNFDYLESEFGAPVSRQLNQMSPDIASDFVGVEKPAGGDGKPVIDFVEACENVKAELMAFQREISEDYPADPLHPDNEVTLADCQQANVGNMGKSLSNSSNKDDNDGFVRSESTEGSLELVHYSSSDDAVVVDGDERKPRFEVLHHIYHQAEVHAAGGPTGIVQEDSAELSLEQSISSTDVSTSLKPVTHVNVDVLLMSASEDSNIWVWNTITGGICDNISPRGNGRDKFIDIAWLNEGNIITAASINRSNQLYFWTLRSQGGRYKLEDDKTRKNMPHDIIAFDRVLQSQFLWGISKRKLVLFDSKTGHIKAQYSGASSNIHSISECPHDMNKVALGLSDKRLGIFDISKLTTKCISIENIPVSGPIYNFAWSPDSLKLAYGTQDGKIGIVNIETLRLMFTFTPIFSKTVYSLVWKESYIYFICNQVVGVYDVNKPKKEAYVVKEAKNASTLALYKNFLLFGTKNGELQLFRLKQDSLFSYELLQKHVLMPRYISDIIWSPHQEDVFAVVGHSAEMYIFRFDEKSSNIELKQKLIALGEKATITTIRWSYLNEDLIVTAGMDGNICVWDLKNPDTVKMKREYNCPMLCASFLPSDDNIIICAGTSTSLEFIHIDMEIKNKTKECNAPTCLQNVQWATKSILQPDAKATSATEKKRLKRAKREQKKRNNLQYLQPNDTQEKVDAVAVSKSKDCAEKSEVAAVADGAGDTIVKSNLEQVMKKLTLEKQPRAQVTQSVKSSSILVESETLLYLATKELNKDALQQLTILLTGDTKKIQESVLCAKLFGSKQAAEELLQIELMNHKNSNTKGISRICMAQINLNLEDEITESIQNKTLTEWHVSLAPSISYAFWRECCSAFAKQLIKQGYVMHGVTYMIAAGQKYNAIETLLKRKFFKEALLIARVYLGPADPLLNEIIRSWIAYLDEKGNLAAAALICVLSEDFIRGYQLLSKIRKPTAEMQTVLDLIKQKSANLRQLLAKSEIHTDVERAAEKGN